MADPEPLAGGETPEQHPDAVRAPEGAVRKDLAGALGERTPGQCPGPVGYDGSNMVSALMAFTVPITQPSLLRVPGEQLLRLRRAVPEDPAEPPVGMELPGVRRCGPRQERTGSGAYHHARHAIDDHRHNRASEARAT